MIYPVPVQGLVVRYNYLWHSDYIGGLTDSGKNRPCALVLYSSKKGQAAVVPITHSPPELGEEDMSIMIPPDICKAIGLDEDVNWVRVNELNTFDWPGNHLRLRPDNPSRFDYGIMPKDFFEQVRDRLVDLMTQRRVVQTKR
ncbi:hypothetical protein [Agrobacterium sp. lyk4-40-TYG-31]|uniref:hypothetical protein n=1 Tax=Agrobacterium sp. lyk4-40-TYG-31 TaxID=3040276 RepID=UPI00254E610D|nr:hypothetical protein [Agrobacterium sp. lyk4-40-TYG-31]